MSQTQNQQSKKRLPQYTNDSILESLRSVTSGVGKTVTNDVVGKVGSDALASLFGNLPRSRDLGANQELGFGPLREKEPRLAVRPPEINLEPLRRDEQAKLKYQIDAVRQELKALSASLKNLHQEVQTAIEQTPVQPGVYHLNFYERLRVIIKILRQQVEDSRSWLALWTNRKKKMGYWGLFKKHGTQFGLSSERSLATSAG